MTEYTQILLRREDYKDKEVFLSDLIDFDLTCYDLYDKYKFTFLNCGHFGKNPFDNLMRVCLFKEGKKIDQVNFQRNGMIFEIYIKPKLVDSIQVSAIPEDFFSLWGVND